MSDELKSLWEEWSTRQLPDGRTFDDAFQVEGLPLWWFLYTRLRGIDIPTPFRTLEQLESAITTQSRRSLFQRAYFPLFCSGLRLGLVINEKLKMFFSNSSKKTTTSSRKPGCLFFDYVSIVKKDQNRIVLYKAEKVRQKIETDGQLESVIILADPISKNSGKKIRSFDHLIYNYIDNEVTATSKRKAKELSHAWRKLDPETKKTIFATAEGTAWPSIKEEFDFLFSFTSLHLILKYFYAFRKVIIKNNIAVAYLNVLEGVYDLCLVAAMKSLDKPIVYSPHGVAPQSFVIKSHSLKKEIRQDIILALSGKEEAAQYEKRGIDKKQIHLTGPMIFDDIIDYFELAKKPHNQSTILFFGQPLAQSRYMAQSTYLEYVRKIFSETAKIPGAKLIIKTHPRENYERDYLRIINELGIKDFELITKPGTQTLYPTIACSDITISFGSTADVEALILGKNVINITGEKSSPQDTKTAFEEAITLVPKDRPLTPILQQLLNNKTLRLDLEKRRQKYLKENFHTLDGKAYERVAQLIYNAAEHP